MTKSLRRKKGSLTMALLMNPALSFTLFFRMLLTCSIFHVFFFFVSACAFFGDNALDGAKILRERLACFVPSCPDVISTGIRPGSPRATKFCGSGGGRR